MKKIFSFFTAVLFAGSMMAQAFDHGLYVPANASVEVASEVGTTATLDATTGDLTINIAGQHTSWGDWGNQIKLSTGVTNLDPTKSYEIGFTAVASTDDCPVSHEKAFDADATMLFDIQTDKYTTTPMEFHQIVSGIGATSGIFVWSFTWAPTQTVTISNFYIRESAVTYSSLADIRNHAKGDVVTLKDFEVTYAPASDTRYYYIKDATSTCVIYANNYGLKAGDKVAMGLEGTVDIYNGLYEIKPTTAKDDLTITAGTPAAPVVATAAPTKADQSKYVVYKNVRVAADTAFVSSSKNTVYVIMGNDTIMFYNSFKIAASLEASKSYDIVAVNSVFNKPQVLPISVEEHPEVVDECAGEHGLYDAAAATINSTYFATVNWADNSGCTAEISNGVIAIHVDKYFADMWQGQVFVDPGFTFTPGKMYHYEFDVVSTGKVGMTVKVNDNDKYAFFVKDFYDFNIGGGTFHFSTDSVIANDSLATTGKGPLVFGFGWTDGDQDVIIKCIKITEIGDAPEPVEKKMYIKHPWGTGADADWTWQEMSECKFKNVDAWTYNGAWGGVGFNIADNAEGTNDTWYATTDIQFLDADQILVAEPAVGTANCEFYFVPSFIGGIVTPAYVVVPAAEGFENNQEAVNAVKVIENGRVVIIKNGVRYNALGAQL